MDVKELLSIWAQNFTGRLALHQLINNAAQLLEQVGLENIKLFAKNNQSLVDTYISALSPDVKSQIKSQADNLAKTGVSIDAVLNIALPELEKKLPQHFKLLKKSKAWYQKELQRIRSFFA